MHKNVEIINVTKGQLSGQVFYIDLSEILKEKKLQMVTSLANSFFLSKTVLLCQ